MTKNISREDIKKFYQYINENYYVQPPGNLINHIDETLFNIYGTSDIKKAKSLKELKNYASEITTNIFRPVIKKMKNSQEVKKIKLNEYNHPIDPEQIIFSKISWVTTQNSNFHLGKREKKLANDVQKNLVNEIEKIVIEELFFNYREKNNNYNLRDISNELIERDDIFIDSAIQMEREIRTCFKKILGIDLTNTLKSDNNIGGKRKCLFNLTNPSISYKQWNQNFNDGYGYFFSNEEQEFYKHLSITYQKYKQNYGKNIFDFVKIALQIINSFNSNIKNMEVNRLERLTGTNLANYFLKLEEFGPKHTKTFNKLFKIPSINIRLNLIDLYLKYPLYTFEFWNLDIDFVLKLWEIIENIISLRLDIDYYCRTNPSLWNGGMLNRNTHITKNLNDYIIDNLI